MPYRKRSQLPSALRGITPPISIPQANQIARVADALAKKEGVKNPWGAAIALFKRSRKKTSKRWSMGKENVSVTAAQAADMAANLSVEERAALADVNDKDAANLQELFFEKMSMSQQRSHIEKAFQVWYKATYVTNGGEYYYSGPYCQDVFMEHPDLGTCIILYHKGSLYAVGFTVNEDDSVSFETMDQWSPVLATYVLMDDEPELGENEVYPDTDFLITDGRLYQYKRHGKPDHALMQEAWQALNIYEGEDKEPALKRLKAAYRLEKLDVPVVESAFEETSLFAELSESDVAPDAIEIKEAADGSGGAYMDIILGKPGWGNLRDNNYYDKTFWAKESGKFEGVQMHVVEHNEEKRDHNTWVATIVEAGKRFKPDGSPIAKVFAHDPAFIERAKNLKAGNLIERMHTSIVAMAKVIPNFKLGDRVGKYVQEITKPKFVDFVNNAGVGGHVIGLYESEADYDLLTIESLRKHRPDLLGSVQVQEGDNVMTEELTATVTQLAEAVKSMQVAQEKMVADHQAALEAERRRNLAILVEKATDIPEVARQKILSAFDGQVLEADYETKVATLIAAEKDYVTKIMPTGVVGLGNTTPPAAQATAAILAENDLAAEMAALDRRYGLQVVA